jgi:hypothetical protein
MRTDLLEETISEAHAGPHTTGLALGLNVNVQWFPRLLPEAINGEAEDEGRRGALLWHNAVPLVTAVGPVDPTTAGHVALPR